MKLIKNDANSDRVEILGVTFMSTAYIFIDTSTNHF